MTGPAPVKAARGLLRRALALFLLAAPWIALPRTAFAGPGPSLAVAEPVFDGGNVAEGAVILHDFILTNKGDSPLVVDKASPTCRCTEVVRFDEVIQPGAKGSLSVRLNTKGFSGPLKKAVIVKTNDPRQPIVRVTITATVKAYYKLFPHHSFSFPRVDRSGGEPETLTISSEDHETFKIIEATVVPQSLELAVKEEPFFPHLGSRYALTVSLTPRTAPGRLTGAVTLKTDIAGMPEYRIPVSGYVLGPVRFDPISLNFIGADGSDARTLRKTVTITAVEGKALRIGKLTPSSPLLKVGRLPGCTESSCTLVVEYVGGGSGIWSASIDVETGIEDQPQITIPVIGKAVAPPAAPGTSQPKQQRGSRP